MKEEEGSEKGSMEGRMEREAPEDGLDYFFLLQPWDLVSKLMQTTLCTKSPQAPAV